MCWGSRIRGLTADGVRLDDREVRCSWVIGADGQKSQVRRWAGLDKYRRESSRFGFRRHYRMAPWTDCMEIYWGAGCQMYVTPVGAGEICVTVISSRPRMKFEDALPAFPEIARRLEGVVPANSERGSVTATCSLKRVAGGRVILIGDASGSVDAITGEGLCLAFRQAAALAETLESGDLAAYQARHRRLERRPAFMARLMLTLDRSPWLCRRALHALSSKPAIFSMLLAMHVGALSPAPLGWRILMPGGGEL
jgi:flavin-dependent dehydrogenase